MPEAADVDLQLNIVDDGRQGVQSNQSNSLLVSHQSFAGFSMDVQRRREYEAELEQANGPHGAAAMALTALSSGMNAALSTEPDVDITSKASSNVPQRNPNIALETVASLAMTEGTILTSGESPAFPLPTVVARTTYIEHEAHLSHLLKDQLSLASMGSEQGWERGHKSVDERSFLEYGDEEANRSFVDDNRSQSYPEQRFYRQSISSPNLRLLEEESQVPKEKYSQRSMPEHLPQATEPQHLSRQYDGPYTPKGPQSFSPLECYSTSSLVEPATGKSKRKYNKKSSRSLSMLENPSQVGSHIVQESELLQSDRGLILKTQIPKKGRPISKHSSASQSTPTFSSFGVLPASHPYFSSKTGMSPTSSLFVMTPSVRPSDPQRAPLTAYPSNIDHLPLPATTTDGSQPHNPTRRGPGRPPLSSTVGGHTHSQSHSSLQSESFTVSNSQPRPARFSPRDSHPHGRPPPPNRISSPFLSTEYFKQKSQHIGHSYTNFQGQEQPQLPGPQHRMAASQYEYEHASEDQQFQTIRHGETLPSPEQRSFAEGIPIPTSNRKRDSYGAEKRRFPDDHYHLEDERKSTVSMHDTDEHRDELNKEQFESTRGRRSNKRLSISEIDYVGLEVDSRDGRENVQRWLGYGPGQHRPRPRSMVLPHGISGSSLQSLFQCATLRTTGTATNSGLHYHASDIDDGEETRLYERKLRDSARYIHHDTTRRPLHGHTRSLDLFNRSCFPLDSHIHRSADHSLEHHSISRRQFGPSDGSDIHIYSRSNSPPAFPVSSHHGKMNLHLTL
ncbi:hypothetical protein BGX27_010151 [Mortierella sp. AM989]|nr:hypothetical protein BGX27_010151 [Mortierella sp. AM989]